MAKQSYYQKKKRENEEKISNLTNDIITLVSKPESVDSMKIKMKWQTKIDSEKAMWFGNTKKIKL